MGLSSMRVLPTIRALGFRWLGSSGRRVNASVGGRKAIVKACAARSALPRGEGLS